MISKKQPTSPDQPRSRQIPKRSPRGAFGDRARERERRACRWARGGARYFGPRFLGGTPVHHGTPKYWSKKLEKMEKHTPPDLMGFDDILLHTHSNYSTFVVLSKGDGEIGRSILGEINRLWTYTNRYIIDTTRSKSLMFPVNACKIIDFWFPR